VSTHVDEADLSPPRDELVRRRWIPGRVVEWVRTSDAILVEHGSVHGRTIYPTHHKARWQARKLIGYMVDLGLHERWHLREHVEREQDGFKWAVEYLGPRRRG
jgi:hypothetical protein